ncbi:MAG: HI0074 family nucleotidyltransferase substrate-binding subunit [Blastocatellales bacterium]|nr:HI0074 family nucleotidyltransferase substrate-binding subunit [Blastocatellales bacterium]
MRMALCERALKTLEEALSLPASVIVRDASIQRFEYSFETTWKLLKLHLDRRHGIICNSPKQCFREAYGSGLLTLEDAEACLEMTDDRNLTAHTYVEAVAVRIHERLPKYLAVMSALLAAVDAQAADADSTLT